MGKLSNKKILITAGPVWVPIDEMRVMTNIFGGALGYVIANEASRQGAKVVFAIGPGRINFSGKENYKIVRFKYYDEIYKFLQEELSTKQYDAIIHSAAIPDYVPINKRSGKIKSGKKELVIRLKPTKKIIDEFKGWDPEVFVVKFKLEVGKTKKQLIDIAHKSMLDSNADLMVANVLAGVKKEHAAYIIENNKRFIDIRGRKKIAQKILNRISKIQ